jgi:DNA invertase Pin-like site-specific DNA recombinase
MGRKIAYRRVSTTDQTTARQLDGMVFDVEFEDRMSGKDTNRPDFQIMMRTLFRGDHLFVHSMDRLNRNLSDLEKTITELIERGVTVEFKKEGLSFSKPEGDEKSFDFKTKMLMLRIMGAIGQFERENIKERQREGIELAKKKGVYLGRKPSLSPVQILEIRQKVKDGVKKSDIAAAYGVSRQTIYTALQPVSA